MAPEQRHRYMSHIHSKAYSACADMAVDFVEKAKSQIEIEKGEGTSWPKKLILSTTWPISNILSRPRRFNECTALWWTTNLPVLQKPYKELDYGK